MQTSNLCSFEQAVKLKELGFDNSNSFHFKGVKDGILINERLPTVSDALDWIREEKGVACSVNFVFKYNDTTDNVDIQYFGQVLQTFPQFIDQVTDDFDTHPLAESALLTAVLEYLIEKEK